MTTPKRQTNLLKTEQKLKFKKVDLINFNYSLFQSFSKNEKNKEQVIIIIIIIIIKEAVTHLHFEMYIQINII
jgi:hypothetical protein